MPRFTGRQGRARAIAMAVAVVATLMPMAIAGVGSPAHAQTPSALPPDAAKTWFFAEGNTIPNWYEFIVMINPNPSKDITVTITFQLEEPAGTPQGTRDQVVDVPAGERKTVPVYDSLGRVPGAGAGVGVYTGVSARLTSDDVFVAERPMYFVNNFDVGVVNGAHDALGVNTASQQWYFAEGSTLASPAPGVGTPDPGLADQYRGFIPFWTMQNVSGGDASVNVTYFTNNPDDIITKTITVPNNSRITTDITNVYNNSAYPASLGANFEGFGTRISSSRPIIVERPFYVNREFPGIGLVNGATDERGALDADQTTQLFAEGTMLNGFFEFLTLFNPNSTDTNLVITYLVEGSSTPVTKTLVVPSLSRRTVQVYNESDPAGLGRTGPNASAPGSAGVSVKIESTNGVGFLAERPLYFIRDFGNGPVNGAHDVLGASSADTSWFFAEGTTRPGFFEFVTVQNPNTDTVTVRLDYFVDDNPIQTRFREVQASSRATVVVFDTNDPGGVGLSGADFGLRVTSVEPDATATIASERPIAVERPVYVNARIADSTANLSGGHNTFGYQFAAEALPVLPGAMTVNVEKQAPAFAFVGDDITYTLTVANGGGDPAMDVVMTDTLPPDTTYQSSSGGTLMTDTVTNTVVFTIPELEPGESVTRTITVKGTGPGTKTNRVQATCSNCNDVDTDLATTQFVAPEPTTLTTTLTGTAEPDGGDPDGSGQSTVTISPELAANNYCIDTSVSDISPTGPSGSGNPVSHTHRAPVGVNGPIVIDHGVFSSPTNDAKCLTVDRELLAEIVADPSQFYVNVHTDDYPGGAVRGQLG